MSFFQKIKDGAAKAADKAQRTVEATKLSALITRKRKEIKENYTSIGSAVYQAYRAGDMALAESEIARLSEDINSIEAVIADLNYRISQLNDVRLCVCGHRAPMDAVFCPSCGRKFDLDDAIVLTDNEVLQESEPNDSDWIEEETPVYEGIETIKCSYCREELPEDETICPHCKAVQVLPGHEER
jgi:hypothetical protein